MKIPFPYVIIIELLCLLSSLYYLNNKAGWWKYFKFFLALTVVVETSAYCIFAYYQKSNHWIHNLFLPIDALFSAWLFLKIYNNYFNSKPWLLLGLTIFLAIYFFTSISNNFLEYSTTGSEFISVFFAVSSCLYYYYLLKQDDYIDLIKHPPFWIITGLFFFYFGRTGCNFFADYLFDINKIYGIPLRYIIFIVLNFILYGCWSYGFICKYRQTISS